MLDDPVDRRDHLRNVCAAVGGRDLETDDPCVGSDTPICGSGRVRVRRRQCLVASRDEACHERPVTVRVEIREVRRLRLQRDVRPVDHLPRCVEALNGRDAQSITATSIPFPVYPAFHQAVAPRYCAVDAIELTSVAGSYVPAVAAPDAGARQAASVAARRAARVTRRRNSPLSVRPQSDIDLLAPEGVAAEPRIAQP